jgi:hypothetical protein
MGAGACRADMAEAADGPDDVDATDCGLAVDIPAVGSALDIGQRYLTGRFLEAASPVAVVPAPLEFADDAEIVEEFDEREFREDEELDRGAVFRDISILLTSSALIVCRPLEAPLAEPHADLDRFWKFGGGATAVI